MTALVKIGSTDERLLGSLRASGIDVRSESPTSTSVSDADVVLIGSDVEAPLQVARSVRSSSPDAHVIFLTTPATDGTLRKQLLLARIGTHWSIAPADEPDAAADVVRQALDGTERRRKFRTTLNRINTRMATAPPAEQRRALISDHFLASVLDQLSDAVVVLDPEGGVLAFNAAAARTFGELRRGAAFGVALPPAARDAIDEASRSARGEAESLLIHSTLGTEYGLRATSLRDADGQVIGTALVARDITDARNEEKRRQLVSRAVQILASTLEIERAMQQLSDLLAMEFADVVTADVVEGDVVVRRAVSGRTARERTLIERTRGIRTSANPAHPSMVVVSRRDTIVNNEIDEAFLRGAATSEEHFRVLRELAPHALLVAPLKSDDGTVGAILAARTTGSGFSYADRVMMEEIARQASTAIHNIWAYRAASEANRLKDEFLATLSHELRTPMTSILGWAQMLRLESDNSDLLGHGLESIERSARAQTQLIDDLLDLSRMQMGKLQFHARSFSIVEVVRAAVETVRPAAQAKGVELRLSCDDEAIITGDPDRIQQVIWNLLSNAVKFSESGSEVLISVEIGGGEVRLRVQDHGRGISPDFLPYVFDRFRQADAVTTRRFGGLGLGLAIVKQLVEMHGGHVTAESAGLGHGATFTVTIPLANPAAAAAERRDDAAAESENLAGLYVIVFDDDSESVVAASIEGAGAEVRRVGSTGAALEALRVRLPDVLVHVLGNADEEGLALIRAVRGRLRISSERLPAIAITTLRDIDVRATVVGSGFQRLLAKPVDARSVVRAVAAVTKERSN